MWPTCLDCCVGRVRVQAMPGRRRTVFRKLLPVVQRAYLEDISEKAVEVVQGGGIRFSKAELAIAARYQWNGPPLTQRVIEWTLV